MPSPTTSGSMPPPSTATASVEYKKDGTVSRMRSHRGNVPQLPQTKLCPFCPAKFTRTTHLNRHLRNHTNERLYRCEVCGAQFTRSDLLARHKRSCGESHPISRSRKRSCQACTSLKVKCDLRQPCSKCRTRERDCIYATEEDQRESGVGSSNPQQASSSQVPEPVSSKLDTLAGFDTSVFGGGSADAFAFPELSLIEDTSNAICGHPLSEANLASFLGGAPRIHQSAMSLPTIDAVSDITSSFRMGGPKYAFTAFGASGVAGHSSALHGFSTTMFEPFFRDVFSVKEETSQGIEPAAAPLLHSPDAGPFANGFGQPDFTQSVLNGAEPLDANLDRDLISDLMANVYHDSTQVPHLMQEPSQVRASTLYSLPAPKSASLPNPQPLYPLNPTYEPSKPPMYTQQDLEPFPLPLHPMNASPPDPTTEELQQYLLVFLTTFLPEIPVVHMPTLRLDRKPPCLIRAMQACGALFAKTRVAEVFVEKTLDTCQEMIRDFYKPSEDDYKQTHINIALLLLETIGSSHQDPQRRASAIMTHRTVVQITRQSRLTRTNELNLRWENRVFPITDPADLQSTWRDWAEHETVKRLVCLAYFHDLSRGIYHSLPPLSSTVKLGAFLPCEDELWAAKTPLEWSQLLYRPSPYGSIEERLHGVPTLDAFASVGLEGPNMTATSTASPERPKELSRPVSPFGHFVLLQALLGELFRRCSGANLPAVGPTEEVNEHVLAMQFALHRWLQMWLKTPNVCPNENPLPEGVAEPGKKLASPLMADPLPFYWLAQLLLLAFQDGLPPFHQREVSAPSTIDSPGSQGLNEPSPFAPSSSASSPLTPPLFPSSSFWRGSVSSGSSPLLSHTPPPAYWSFPGHPPPAGTVPYDGTLGTGSANVMPEQPDEAQFYLIKRWLHHIRLFLRRNQGAPTVMWDELMKIRLGGWLGDGDPSSSGEHESDSRPEDDGLVGFFVENMRI